MRRIPNYKCLKTAKKSEKCKDVIRNDNNKYWKGNVKQIYINLSPEANVNQKKFILNLCSNPTSAVNTLSVKILSVLIFVT